MSERPLIETVKLTKTFGQGRKSVEVLRGIDLAIGAGEIFGVVGLSGVGKSTLIRCLNRLEAPTSGKIVIDGRDVTSLSEKELRLARREMGMIFQSFNLLASRTAFDNVAFPLEVAGLGKKEIKKRVRELLELVGLSDRADSYPRELSGGQKQRVGIARALANKPKILLCDEATSALDPQTTTGVLELIADVQKSLGLTVVLITHEMKVIVEICDRVAVMDEGRIVEMGPVVEVFANPQSPVTQGFVEAILKRNSRFLENGYRPKGSLWRLAIVGDGVTSPVVTDLARNFDLEAIILQAHVDHIKDTPFGTVLIDLAGPPEKRSEARKWLLSRRVRVEVL
ncbi:MAG: ATP-binding cassette domain-containing protein [Deltaproteobacteria bacterium]|nr:ATP-binding cassette domain-containing protein [Deltaproteobacteria bacterium]